MFDRKKIRCTCSSARRTEPWYLGGTGSLRVYPRRGQAFQDTCYTHGPNVRSVYEHGRNTRVAARYDSERCGD